MQSLIPVYPEIFIVIMASILLLVDLLWSKRPHLSLHVSQATVLIAGLWLWFIADTSPQLFFQDEWVNDKLSIFLKSLMCFMMFVVYTYGGRYLTPRGLAKGEYYVLSLFSLTGMMVLVSSYSFLSMYLGIELLSLPLYVMVAFNRHDVKALEAAVKYFVLGGLASGLMLYGISLIYGATGEIGFLGVQQALSAQLPVNVTLLQCGLIFVFVGILFKLGAAPFHMWIPDVYAGAPSSVALLIAAIPKVAAFGIAYRLLAEVFWQYSDFWQQFIGIAAVLSLALGNMLALVQTNIRRLLGYSAVSHIGFILLGLLAGPKAGYASAFVYTVIYALMTLAAFGLVLWMSRAGYEFEEISDLKGLGQRAPMTAFMFLLVFFSMAGIPPLLGFYGKLLVLKAVMDAGQLTYAIIAILFSLVGAVYYLKVIKVIYFEEPGAMEAPGGGTTSMRFLLTANGLSMLALGLFPGVILGLAHYVLQ